MTEQEIVVDLFAGGGGASLGIKLALGVDVTVAVNHDPLAIEMHKLNHPGTRHECSDVWEVDPVHATSGRPVGLLLASPDCTHFSRAKGGKPVQKKIRSLAWVVVRWARAVRPRVIILENVPEFREWGPLLPDNRPCPRRKGDTYHLWCNQLRGLGYKVESRELRACDYGVPTIRKRLFVIARCDGEPIVWPDPTHGPSGELFGLNPYRTAAECIDWSIPCPSIFERKRPLAEKTLERIARGIRKYVLDAGNPFVVTFRTGATGHAIGEPMHTITAGSFIKRPAGAGHAMGLCVPTIVAIDHKGSGGTSVWNADAPTRTITQENRFALVSAFMSRFNGQSVGSSPQEPASTAINREHDALVVAHLHNLTHGGWPQDVSEPLKTVTAAHRGEKALVMSHLTKLYGTNTGSDMREPVPTVTGGGQHIGEVRAFLIKYYKPAIGQRCDEPIHTLTSKARFGLVTVAGQDYQIADIGLRMLTPRELARAQGFPDEYVLTGSKSNQVSRIGNSVCPPLAKALVTANVTLRQVRRVAGAAV